MVALDIETTGLDPDQDAILEIGAVRFNDHRVEAEWTTLINPGRRIPPFITQLTGITDQMVLQSPNIHEVLPDLQAFVGDDPILGHNVGFDLGFLRRFGILRHNDLVDTYEMAAVLLPTASRYNLGALAQGLGIPAPGAHRGLQDARITRMVYQRLFEQALELPLPLLAEIIRLGEGVEWGGYLPLRLALRLRSQEIVSSNAVRHAYEGPIFDARGDHLPPPLQPQGEPSPLDAEEVGAILAPGGLFSHYFPNFEYRPQQVAMLEAVTQALSYGRHLMVEAGTGTGKSMAYLVPAALWALHNQRRVVISTNTINLQDQLINKDIPDLRNALGIDLQATVLKGRGNYLCPRRLENLRRHGPEKDDEVRVLGKVLVWLQGTYTGDRSEINLNGPVEREIWQRISAEDENCTTETCVKKTGGICPFYRARQAAQSSHLLIVNHSLLLADVATGNRVLPEYDYVIVDEAHHLEDATTNALSFRVTQADIERLMRELGGPKNGLLGWLLTATEGVLPPSEYATLNQLVQQATDQEFRLEALFRELFVTLNRFLEELRGEHQVSSYSQQERILPAIRTQPGWEEVELAWDEAEHTFKPLLEGLAFLAQGLAQLVEDLADENQELYGSLVNLYRRMSTVHDQVDNLIFNPAPDQIYWAEILPNGNRLSLNVAPLHIGSLMEKYLWHEKASVVLTSATLTAAGEFEYLRGRLSAIDADELALGSPFDYETAALVYLVNDIPEPSDRQGHQKAVESGIIRLCRATGGRALVLFTSYDQLRRTSQAIGPVLARDDIIVFEQGEGASPHALLESFRSTERAVLLGTRAVLGRGGCPGRSPLRAGHRQASLRRAIRSHHCRPG